MTVLDPVLRALARLAITQGWLFPALADRLRHAYLAAADSGNTDQATDSRISVMTGLQRRDIARLRKARDATPKHQRQPLAEIIAMWWDDPVYNSDALPITGDGASFATLARSVRKDVHPRTFLDMLKQAGAVAEKDGQVRLLTRSYVPATGSADQLAYLADNVADHLTVAAGNVTDGTGGFDLAVHYRGLSADAVADLDALWRARQSDIMGELDTLARSLPDTANDTHRFRAGAYFHKEDTGT